MFLLNLLSQCVPYFLTKLCRGECEKQKTKPVRKQTSKRNQENNRGKQKITCSCQQKIYFQRNINFKI